MSEAVAERGVRLKGVGKAAADLGVTSQHLRLVVMGKRPSRDLLWRVQVRFPALLAPGGKTWGEGLK